MDLENLNVQELNTEEQKDTNGGRNVNEGECNGGAFNEPHQTPGDVAWWWWG